MVPFLFSPDILLADEMRHARGSGRHGLRGRPQPACRDALAPVAPGNHRTTTPGAARRAGFPSLRAPQTSKEQWERSLHSDGQADCEATVVGDFRRRTSRIAAGHAVRHQTAAICRIAAAGASGNVSGRLHAGFKRYQGYLSKLADGRIRPAGVLAHRASAGWIGRTKRQYPDGAHHRQIWNVNFSTATPRSRRASTSTPSATRRRGRRWASGARRVTVPAATT